MRRPAVWVFVACLVVYHANGRPYPEVDCVAAPYTAWSMVRHGSLDLRPYPELGKLVGLHVQEARGGAWVSLRPPGGAAAAVPFVAPFVALRDKPLRPIDMHNVGKLAAAVSVAGAAALFFLTCRRWVPGAEWPATVLFAFGTCLWSVASQALWTHGPATFWLCLALYLLSRDVGRGGSFAAGFALGLAVLTRPTTAFFALATEGALAARGRWSAATWTALGGAVPGAVLAVVNWAYFGHPLLGGYVVDNWGESPPLWLGFGGLLVAPSRGLFVYTPALLVAIPGTIRLIRHRNVGGDGRGLVLWWLAAAGATLWFHARWHDWKGGWCYGPRFLCETMPVLCLLFAIGYDDLRPGWPRKLAWGLVGLSVAVHVVGVFGYRKGYEPWQARHHKLDQGRCLFELHDTQIEAHARSLACDLLRVPDAAPRRAGQAGNRVGEPTAAR